MFETQTTRTRTQPDYSIPEPYPNPTFLKLKLLILDPTRISNTRTRPEPENFVPDPTIGGFKWFEFERFDKCLRLKLLVPVPNPTIQYPNHTQTRLFKVSNYS